jgi:hypothetical protein
MKIHRPARLAFTLLPNGVLVARKLYKISGVLWRARRYPVGPFVGSFLIVASTTVKGLVMRMIVDSVRLRAENQGSCGESKNNLAVDGFLNCL